MNKYLIIAVIVGLIYYFSKKKKKIEPEVSVNDAVGGNKPINKPGEMDLTEQIVSALSQIKDEFGKDIAEKVEKIYRLETAHFKSGQFLRTFSPGMEKHKNEFPFGWKTMEKYWRDLDFVPDFHSMPENVTGKMKTFLKFPNVLIPMRGLAMYIKKYSPERWYALDPNMQAEYRDKLSKIKAKIVDKL